MFPWICTICGKSCKNKQRKHIHITKFCKMSTENSKRKMAPEEAKAPLKTLFLRQEQQDLITNIASVIDENRESERELSDKEILQTVALLDLDSPIKVGIAEAELNKLYETKKNVVDAMESEIIKQTAVVCSLLGPAGDAKAKELQAYQDQLSAIPQGGFDAHIMENSVRDLMVQRTMYFKGDLTLVKRIRAKVRDLGRSHFTRSQSDEDPYVETAKSAPAKTWGLW
jgi:hypothetical protein